MHEEFRKYLVGRCYATEPTASLAYRLDSFAATLVEHRWGYLIAAAKTIKDLEYVLRAGWDEGKLLKTNIDTSDIGDAGAGDREAEIAGEGGDEAVGASASGVGKKGSANVSDADIKTASQFVTSAARWAYLEMLLLLSVVLEKFTAWFESCPCHPSRLLDMSGESWGRRYRAFISQIRSVAHGVGGPLKPCPMLGRQAWRVAKGEHWVILRSWFSQARARLLGIVARVRSTVYQNLILGDFDCGSLKVTEVLRLRLSYTDVLPFQLAILNDPDQTSARSGYRRCLQMFAGGGATLLSDDPEHHRLTIRFCHPGSILYDLGVLFLSGGCLKSQQLQKFRQAAVEAFYFLMMVERSAERNHSLAQMAVAISHNHTEAYFSLGCRRLEIEAIVDDDDGEHGLVQLSECCSLVRDPSVLAREMRLASHPDVLQGVADGVKAQKLMEILRPIVYRADVFSQQITHTDAVQTIKKSNKAREKRTRKEPKADGISTSTSTDSMMRSAATEHLRKALSPGAVVSFDTSIAGMPCESVSSRLSHKPVSMSVDQMCAIGQAQQPATSVSTGDVSGMQLGYMEDSALGFCQAFEDQHAAASHAVVPFASAAATPVAPDGRVYFKILSSKAQNMKSIKYGYGVCQGFASDEFTVSLYNVTQDSLGRLLLVENTCDPLDSISVCSFPLMCHKDLRVSTMEFARNKHSFRLLDAQGCALDKDACDVIVQEMIKRSAFETAPVVGEYLVDQVEHGTTIDYLLGMQADGIVTELAYEHDPRMTSWIISRQGMSRLRFCLELGQPTAALQYQADRSLKDCSVYALLDRLLSDMKWELKQVASHRALVDLPSYGARSADKSVYTTVIFS